MSEASGIGRRRAAAREEGSPAYRERLGQIVDAAIELFREKGYEGTTLNDVAAAVDSDRASLYYYVASKDELLSEVASRVSAINTAAAKRIAASDQPAAGKIRDFVRMLMTSYADNYPQMFVFIGQDLAKVNADQSPWARSMHRQMRTFDRLLVGMLTEGVDDGSLRSDLDVELATKALWGMLNWTHRWFRPGQANSATDVADTFASLFLEGFATKRRR